MTPFTTLRSIAAPMPDADIDTDIIFPARFLLLTQKTGLGAYAFYDKRFDATGARLPDFVLHRAPWTRAQVLVAGPNFGCGSSREQAPWALSDLGLRCIIAPGFGEIFEANCLNHGLLTIMLPPVDHARTLAAAQSGQALTVSLDDNLITLADGLPIPFGLRARARQALLMGWDEIDRVVNEESHHIAAFEKWQRATQPWLFDASAASDF